MKLTTHEHTSRTFTIKSSGKDNVRLTLDESDINEVFISITSHRTAFSMTRNSEQISATEWLLSKSVDDIIKHLVPSHLQYEFDPTTTAKRVHDIVKAKFSDEGATQDEYEEFWEEYSYSLENAETREEAIDWVIEHIEDTDQYDALGITDATRYTAEVRLMSEDAIPMIKQAIKTGMISEI
ncbi:hypothetical protein VCHA53O466_40019 [Vibrio chagasii]|nr:hypothetical protein VCHA53O466_40019 [Vibrio chagasii]